MSWWKDESLIISAVQCKYHETSEDIFDNYVKQSHFNTEQLLHLTADGHMAYYNEERDGKKLDEYIKKSRKEGIREIVYINVHGVTPEDHAKHPEYSLIGEDGQPLMMYNNTHYYICYSGPWFEEHIRNIKALCTHDIDGIFLDGPNMRPDACYCPHCLKEFEKQYGKSRREAVLSEITAFNTDQAVKFVKATYEAIKEVNPNILLYINNVLLKPDSMGVTARKTEPYVDIIGVEGGFVWVNKAITMWHVSPMVKMAETICNGKPRVCFIAGDHKPWSYYMHTACETDIFYAQSVAYGANVWYGLHGSSKQGETPGGKAATQFNKFILDNKDNLLGTSPCAKVALFWSDTTANRYSTSVEETDFIQASMKLGDCSDIRGNQHTSFRGMYDLLTRSHIQFDIIDEVSFEKGQHQKYELIIMTTAACLSDEIAKIVREYVENGGKIISTFDTGLYDESCIIRENFVLADVMGIEKYESIIEYASGCGYLVNNKNCTLFKDSYDDNIPMPDISVKAAALPSADVKAYAREALGGRYVDLVREKYPSIISNQYGKGESLYISGAVGEFFDTHAISDWRKIITNAVEEMSPSQIVTNAPGSVEISLRKKDNKYIMHLINLTGEMTRPIERIIPISDVEFTVRNISDVVSVKTLRGKQKLEFTCDNDNISFMVPRLYNHEIIVIEYKEK